MGVAIHELRVLLNDGIASGWFHVGVVILTRPIDQELLSIVIPLRSSHPSGLDQQMIPNHQLPRDSKSELAYQ